jgi:hypothetical protein
LSDYQTAFTILWQHATAQASPASPFEIDEVVSAVATALKTSPEAARRLIGGLLLELGRMPEGRRFFIREGNAVVPSHAFLAAVKTTESPLDAYPYEL